MKRNNTEQVGDVIRRLLRQEGLETPLNEYRLIEAWKDVVGPVIVRYTQNLYIKNQVLYVHLSSSVLRQELSMSRTLLGGGTGDCEHRIQVSGSIHSSVFGPYFVHGYIQCIGRKRRFAKLKMEAYTYFI